MRQILLVKTSSLGDVIHNLPAVSDIRRCWPDARIDWVVEEAFAAIPALHPAIGRVIPVALRRWRGQLHSPSTWHEMRAFLGELRRDAYGIVLDSQGLIKSALIARLARGLRCGLDKDSAREPLAARFYDKDFAVPRNLHAVERNRLLAAQTLGCPPGAPLDYGIAAPAAALDWLPGQAYAVLLHATSRDDKLWPEPAWIELAAHFNRSGMACVLPWGSAREQERSRRLAQQMALAVVPPPLSLPELAALLGRAAVAVGVDTGLTHLAAALDTPVVALYCASRPGLTGVYGRGAALNLGEAGRPPQPQEVIAALHEMLPS